MDAKKFSFLAAITVLGIIAAFLAARHNMALTSSISTQKVFPNLLNEMPNVAKIEIKTHSEVSTLVLNDKQWQLKEHHHYHADTKKIVQLLNNLTALTYVEAKTSNPILYEKLGVEDITNQAAQSVQLSLLDHSNKPIIALLMGKARTAKVGMSDSELYIRLPSQAQSWLAKGLKPIEKTTHNWLDKTLVSIATEAIQQVAITHGSGEEVLITKENPEGRDFTLVGLPDDAELEAPYYLQQMASTITQLALIDVKPAEQLDFSDTEDLKAIFTRFDGLQLSMILHKQADKIYARLHAKWEKVATKEEKLETDKLNIRFNSWAFELPSYQVSALYKTYDDLIKKSVVTTENTAQIPVDFLDETATTSTSH